MRFKELSLPAFRWFCLAAAFVFVFPFSLYLPVGGAGLDPSWHLALHHAHEQGMVFGRDVLFTYGPLGILSTRMPFDGVWRYLIASDLLLYSSIVYVLLYIRRSLTSYMACAGLLIAVANILWYAYLTELSVTLLLLFAFFLFHYLKHGRPWALCAAATHATVCFFLKANTGIIALGLFYAAAAYLLVRPGARKHAVGALLFQAALFMGIANVVNVDLAGYVKSSLIIASGYNDAQFVTFPVRGHYLSLAVLMFGATGIYAARAAKYELRTADGWIRCGIAVLVTFLIFKQGFVRADGHETAFFCFFPALLGILLQFTAEETRADLRTLITVSLVLCFPIVHDQLKPDRLRGEINGPRLYAEELLSTPEVFPPSCARLPDDLRERLSTGTVDVIPTEVALIHCSKLAYNPRPVFQSYSAFNEYLDRVNAAKYEGPTAPDWLLFRVECIDGRYCFGDETRTKRAMLERYREVVGQAGFLVFSKRKEPMLYSESASEISSGRFGEPIPLSSTTDPRITRFRIDYTPIGKLLSLIYKPSDIRIRFDLMNGEVRNAKAIRGIMEGGIFTNRYVETDAEAEHFFGRRWNELQEIRTVTFESLRPWMYRSEIRVESTYLR